jgi:hypothetical protein
MVRQIGCLLLFVLAGCKGPGLPADPLFGDNKPVESKVIAGPPVAMPDREPTPPVQTFYTRR